MKKERKSIFETPLLSSKVKSANPKFFPEAALGFFLGPTLALLGNSILSSYLNKYLTDILQIGNFGNWGNTFLTLLPVLSVVFVVLGNILVGKLMDKNKTKAGKARPILLLALPVMILALLLLFIIIPIPFAAGNQVLTVILVAVGYNLWFSVAYPLYFTPHSSLVNLSTRSSSARGFIATISNATSLAAIGLTSMVLPFFLGFLFKIEGGVVNVDYSINAWKVFSIGIVVLAIIGVFVEYFFTRERVTEEQLALQTEETKKETITTKEQAKIVFKDKFWVLIILFFFLYQLGGMLKNVSQIYYCASWMPGEDGTGGAASGLLSIVGAIPTALGMLIALPIANKIGKSKAILFGAIISVIGGSIGFLVPLVANQGEGAILGVTIASFVIKALGSTPAMYLSLALLGDVLDHQEALHGKRTDGLTMTIYGAIMAGMTGVATGVLNGVLGGFGYKAENPSAVQWPMLFVFVGGETLCYLAIFVLMIFMRVEKFSKLDHKAIEDDQRAKAKKLGIEYVSGAEKLEREALEDAKLQEEARRKELEEKCKRRPALAAKYEEEYKQQEEKLKAKKEADLKKKQESEAKAKAKEEARLAKLSDAQKEAIAQKEAVLLEEFEALREKYKESRNE